MVSGANFPLALCFACLTVVAGAALIVSLIAVDMAEADEKGVVRRDLERS
jgi:hypothetical protein